VLRGLGFVLPPLLTLVVFLWAWNLISFYVLEPVEGAARWIIVNRIWDVRTERPGPREAPEYHQLGSGQWIPHYVYEAVQANPGVALPQTAAAYFDRYVEIRYLGRTTVIPLFLSVFILVLYVLGKFLAAGVGSLLWGSFESLIHRLPIIRNVYSSVKQVTDFVFTEREIEFSRVVAVEYPRAGTWAIAFVTGEGMLDINSAANEPTLSLLVPTSPIPGTGFTVMVRKSDIVDLNITLDQAIQYIVSCGVIIPRQQHLHENVATQLSAAVAARSRRSSDHRRLAGAASSGGKEPRPGPNDPTEPEEDKMERVQS
jgi:uncharacterized membrane protein